MDRSSEGVLLPAAVMAALGVGLLAVALHRECTESGYELARAQRDSVRLRRELTWAQQRVAALRAPAALLGRARAMGLTVHYPRRWNVIAAEDVLRVRHERRAGALTGLALR